MRSGGQRNLVGNKVHSDGRGEGKEMSRGGIITLLYL